MCLSVSGLWPVFTGDKPYITHTFGRDLRRAVKLVDVITISGAEGICPEFIHLVDELFDSSRILLLSAPVWRQGASGATKYELQASLLWI